MSVGPKNMVLIVGAGASSEFELPTGDKLKRNIANLLDIRFQDGLHQSSGDPCILGAIEAFVKNNANQSRLEMELYLQAAHQICLAMPMALSIDHFLDAHQGNRQIELCGKLAIVRSILSAEKQSLLFFDNNQDRSGNYYPRLQNTWLTSFFQLITENCRVNQLSGRLSRLSLIIFNYDRCVEHYLYRAIQDYYKISAGEAAELLGHLSIFHPYGTVGSLPWQKLPDAIEYGGDPTSAQLLDLASRIRTFTEGTDPSKSDINAIRLNIYRANLVLFLGFAYHQININMLKFNKPIGWNVNNTEYFGTAIGISPSNCRLVAEELHSLCNVVVESIHIHNNLKCTELFREFWRTLSMAQ